jgi:hypothetical protein
MFAGARAYIGTLFPVTGVEAAQVAEFFVEHDEDMTLAEALWHSQNRTYGQPRNRRPYVIMGVYPQSLHVLVADVPSYIRGRLEKALEYWNRHPGDRDSEKKAVAEIVRYYRSEFNWFETKWGGSKRVKRKRRLFRP